MSEVNLLGCRVLASMAVKGRLVAMALLSFVSMRSCHGRTAPHLSSTDWHIQYFIEQAETDERGVREFAGKSYRSSFLTSILASQAIRLSALGAGRLSRANLTAAANLALKDVKCPVAGLGLEASLSTEIEDWHKFRFRHWVDKGLCGKGTGLWSAGCGIDCPLRAATIGQAVSLSPGQLVLDVGSACGHFARWFHDWFGASTFGVDVQEDAVHFATAHIPEGSAMKFCFMDVAHGGLAWLPEKHFDLAIAVSVLHYMRTDEHMFEREPNSTRSTCAALPQTARTQCRAAREMFRAVKIGGRVWIAHNGTYKRKWDPRYVWGPAYWRCCFAKEIKAGAADLLEVPELQLFMSKGNDATYSVVIERLA